MSAIEASGITKKFLDDEYNEIPVIKDLTFTVEAGEFVSIVGPSGCGKSTMFNIVSGLLQPTSGEISVFGNKVTGPDPAIGYMMQRDLLLPWRTVLQNIELGLEIKGTPSKERRERAMGFLDRFNLSDFADSTPDKLSGGMRQRVALMRTLAIDPDIILLDEPFSALDYQTRLILEDEVLETLRDLGKTGVLITHDIGEAITMSDRIIVVAQRPTYVKTEVESGLARKHGDTTAARAVPEYTGLFSQIWDTLDIQMARK